MANLRDTDLLAVGRGAATYKATFKDIKDSLPAASDASETAKGVVELATAAETTTGTDSTRAVHPAGLKVELDKKAPLASPALTGTPTAPTAAAGTNNTQIATTAYVDAAVAVEDLWQRSGTEISPETDGDDVFTSGSVKVGGTTAAPNITIDDGSGRLLVGTSSTPVSATAVLQGRSGATTGEAILRLCRGQDTPPNGATLGDLTFGDSNNGPAARIFAQRDGGTWTSATSRPSRLVFSTTTDSASIPTERVRIDSSGKVGIGTTPTNSLHVFDSTADVILKAESGNSISRIELKDNIASNYISAVGANLDFATNGITPRMRVNSSGNVGIGTISPQSILAIRGNTPRITLEPLNDTSQNCRIQFTTADGTVQSRLTGGGSDGNQLRFSQGSTERARIDSDGRLLVGTSSTSALANTVLQGNSANFSQDGRLYIQRGATSLSNNTRTGQINFADSASNVGAAIESWTDDDWASGDNPGRLVFSTTADGASSPTERMRITQAGIVSINTTDTTNGRLHVVTDSTSLRAFAAQSSNASFTENIIISLANRTPSEFFSYYAAYNRTAGDTEFALRGDGNAYADGSWNGGGADYAEYFEWSDGNPDEEDRRGISVVLDGNRIRPAVAGEEPIGVISGNPSIVGDAAWNKWNGKYLRDDYGTYIQEDYAVVNDEGVTVIQQRRKLNPAYDPDVKYISREDRHEWGCVGLMGKLRIRKGQPTGSRWIKMRDISDSIEEWLVR